MSRIIPLHLRNEKSRKIKAYFPVGPVLPVTYFTAFRPPSTVAEMYSNLASLVYSHYNSFNLYWWCLLLRLLVGPSLMDLELELRHSQNSANHFI